VSGPATISNISVPGWVAIGTSASVTFDNDLIRCGVCGGSGSPIVNDEGNRGVTIEHSTIGPVGGGADCTGPVAGDVGNGGMVLNEDVLDCASTPINGSGFTVTNSYLMVDGFTPNSHNEDIYQPGGGSNTITHNTLLEPLDATAVIFMDAKFGTEGPTTISGNLIAGAGYGDGAVFGGGGSVNVTNNVFSSAYGEGNPGEVCPNTGWSGNTVDGTGASVPVPSVSPSIIGNC
jgi:hypothetical protein